MFEFIVLVALLFVVIFGVGVIAVSATSPNRPFPWDSDQDIDEAANKTVFDTEYDKLMKLVNEPALIDLTSTVRHVHICMGSNDNVKIPVLYSKRSIEVFGLNVPIQEYYLDLGGVFKIGSQTFNDLVVTRKYIDKLQLKSSKIVANGSLQQVFTQRVTLLVTARKKATMSSFRYTGRFRYDRVVRVTFKGETRRHDAVESIVTVCSVDL
jgi:hypothetical protein